MSRQSRTPCGGSSRVLIGPELRSLLLRRLPRRKTVAVIDQNIVTRALLKAKLSRTGHKVSAFESDLAFLGSSRTCWDLIVVDHSDEVDSGKPTPSMLQIIESAQLSHARVCVLTDELTNQRAMSAPEHRKIESMGCALFPKSRKMFKDLEQLVPEVASKDSASDSQPTLTNPLTPVLTCSPDEGLVESQEHDTSWMASMVADAFPLFAVPAYQYSHTELDVTPSTADLGVFSVEEINTMCDGLIKQIDELQCAYVALSSHLRVVTEVLVETEALLMNCFLLQHNLAAWFKMLGMERCAQHSRNVELKMALFPPVHTQYPLLQDLTEEASCQIEKLWASPCMLNELIMAYGLHMTQHNLPLPIYIETEISTQ